MTALVGFIGLGQMGRPMASNMVRAGFDLVVFDRMPDPVAALTALGATAASDVTGLAKQCSVVFTMLPDPASVRSVVLSELLPALAPGSIVVDLSTVDPWTTDELHQAASDAGHRFLDSPVGRSGFCGGRWYRGLQRYGACAGARFGAA